MRRVPTSEPGPPVHLRSDRHGWGLLQVLGGLFAGSLTLGVCVPLFLTAQRQADLASARTRLTLQAREISSHFREDVRQAALVRVADGGRALELIRFSPARPGERTQVNYRVTPGGLQREVQSGAITSERSLYGGALTGTRFGRSGAEVTARLDYSYEQYGRTVRYQLDCSATPRSNGRIGP